MTKEEIIRMAREAGVFSGANEKVFSESLERFVALVAAHEREECAMVCAAADKSTHPADLADSIRARGKK
jgi:hypothetical protein